MADETYTPSEMIESLQPKEALSDPEIEQALEHLYLSGVLGGMRANVQSDRTLFSPTRGYVTERDGSETGNVLDMFRDAISSDEEEAIRHGLYTPEEVENMVRSLEPGSDSRKILLAYWHVNEESTWRKTSDNICDRQSYKREGFPSPIDVRDVSSNLKLQE